MDQATPFPLVPQNALSAESRTFSINDLPPAVRPAFPGLKTFNKLQVAVAGAVFQTDNSLVVNAPTGSGKTAILELAIVKLSLECVGRRPFRVVYLAPTRSLCAEKFHDWRVRLAALGISCVQYDGDNEVADIGKLNQYQLILSTPEKWEVFTRHWGDPQVTSILRPIRLFLIDEIQVMDDGVRGANLELVVSRMKYIDSRIHREQRDDTGRSESIRYIAVSACIPNVDDIARWLKNERDVLPFSFAETFRATRVGRHVVGFPCTSNPYKFELDLNYKLPAIIDEYSGLKPTLVFCSSRKSAEVTAQVLARSNMRRLLPGGRTLEQMSSQLASKPLQDCVAKGVAFHHAGLLLTDRNCIESHFRAGHLAALCCTSTLCMGVNLPAYLVIIKSTFSYGGKNYSDNYILQMMGRAGRAQYNEDGVAVILTADENVNHYRKLVAGTAPVESQLHHRLAELLNSEIAHGIIHDEPAVMEWIRSTFFHVRARTNPSHYNLAGARDIDDEIERLCRGTIDSLEESGLILKRRPNALLPTVCGKLMTRNHLSFHTMKLLQTEMKGTETLEEMLLLVTRAHEFSEYKCRNNEKRILNALNAPSARDTAQEDSGESPTGVRFRWPGRISSTAAKVYCLVQAVFGNLTVPDHGLHQEATKIIGLGVRIGRCVVGLLEANGAQLPTGCFGAMVNATLLVQCFQARLWYDSPFLTKQLDQIGPKLARHLADRRKITFQAIRESDPREIECILKKQPPFGNDIISFLDSLPQFGIKITKTIGTDTDDEVFSCTVTQRNMAYDPARRPISFSVLVGDSANQLLLHRTVASMSFNDENQGQFSWPIYPTNTASVGSISAHLICQDWVGLDCTHTLYLSEPPAITRHKQTTITHFFPNQSSNLNETTLLVPQPEAFPIPCTQRIGPRYEKARNRTANESFEISSFFNQVSTFNRTNEQDTFILPERVSSPKRYAQVNSAIPEATQFQPDLSILNKSFGVPTVFKSVHGVQSFNVSSWSADSASTMANKSLMAMLRNSAENIQHLRKDSFETTNMGTVKFANNLTATSNAHNISRTLLFPQPPAPERLPIRSILKRPGTSAFRHKSRPYFSSEEFRYLFRKQKCTLYFIFCSPSEDILDCFKRHNIFLPVGGGMQGSWPPLVGKITLIGENADGMISPAVRKKKNFDLGRAEDVICLDDE